MRPPKRPRVTPTDDWPQLRLLLDWSEQVTDEVLRPVVLFGLSPAERAQRTGTLTWTIHRKAHTFDQRGMARLFANEREHLSRMPVGTRETTGLASSFPTSDGRPIGAMTTCG